MKIVRFTVRNKIKYGVLKGNIVHCLRGSPFLRIELDGSTYGRDEVRLLAPCYPSKIVAIGLNYRSHAEETGLPIIEGRGLRPGDASAILVSPGFLASEPTLRLGSPMKIKIEGREQTYTIVGLVNMIGNDTIGYMTLLDYYAYARHVREPNRANSIVLTLDSDSLEDQRAITSAVEQQFDRADIEVVNTFLVNDEREEIDAAFGILVALLMIMTFILAAVGSLGLTGTMSLNVIERVREIGVMRAYGAPSAAISRIVIVEGLLNGMMSWILAIGLSENGLTLMGDSDGLIRLFAKLLDNAIKYTERGTVTVSARPRGDEQLVVTISDTGVGIAPEHLPHVFDRFYRVDESRSSKDGTGLGLATVRSIAQAHGGTVTVASAVGAGSTFIVQLPVR